MTTMIIFDNAYNVIERVDTARLTRDQFRAWIRHLAIVTECRPAGPSSAHSLAIFTGDGPARTFTAMHIAPRGEWLGYIYIDEGDNDYCTFTYRRW